MTCKTKIDGFAPGGFGRAPFCRDRRSCASGIHFFLTLGEAICR